MPDGRPLKRHEELDIRELPDNEMFVYDRRLGVTHHLAPKTALVWERCDGSNNRADLERIVSSEFNLAEASGAVDEAISRLDRLDLIRL